jgi:hypothetical protein
MASQLIIAQLSEVAIATLVRSGNTVTVTVAAAPSVPYSVQAENGSGFIISLGQTVTIAGTTAAGGNDFDGSYPVSAAYPTGGLTALQFQYLQVAPDDTGTGGTASVTPCGFTDLPDGQIAGGQPLTDVAIQAINHNAKYGGVRSEELTLGYFTSGNYMPTVVSPVDGYIYSMDELTFHTTFASSRQPGSGFTPGQTTFPVLANSDIGTGNVLAAPYQLYVDRTSGVLICQVYFSTSGAANQGTVEVTVTAQRGSVNV